MQTAAVALLLAAACCGSCGALQSAPSTAHVRGARCHAPAAAAGFDRGVWATSAWDGLSTFDKMAWMRRLLDGSMSASEVNHAAWRGMGYQLGSDAVLCAPDGSPCATPPDVLADAGVLAALEAALPLDDDDEMESFDTLVETLHGEELTQLLIHKGDADFLARRTLLHWLYTSQPGLMLR